MARPHLLRTRGSISLTTADDANIPLDEPALVALLALLAVAGNNGVSSDELLLRLTPAATAEHGRTEIARLVSVARTRLGGASTIVETQQGYALAPGVLALDVRVLDAPSSGSENAGLGAAFLNGFKLPGSPEFREWLDETRRRISPIDVAPTPKPTPRWRSRVMVIAGAVALVLILAGVYLARPHASSGFATGDPLLLADIKNDTGDSLYSSGVMSAATIALQQSGRLRIYPRARVANVYRLMQITNPDTTLTFDLAKEVAQRDGTVRFVLGLEIARVGEGFQITARLADATGAEAPVEFVARAKSKNEVIAALDQVLVDARSRLGESRGEIKGRRARLPYVTTASLEALRSYGDGATAWSKGDYTLANEQWHRAVDLDTGFAMAYAALGRSYYFNHDRQRGEQYFSEAFKRTSRLTEGELLRLQESAADYRGHPDSSIVYSALLAERFPSVTSWFNYGTGLMALKRDSQAIVALNRALAFDPKHIGSMMNLAVVSKHQDRFEQALDYYAKAGALDSTVLYRGNANAEWASTFVSLGRYAEAESAFTRMARGPSIGARALGLRSLGFLASWQGRTDDAIRFYRQATDAAIQLHSALGELRDRLLLVSAYNTVGLTREATEELNKSLAIVTASPGEPQVIALVATACVKMGRTADARAMLALIHAHVRPGDAIDAAAEAYTSGLVALATNHPDSALHYAQLATRYPVTVQQLALEAEAYRRLGQLDSARATVTRLRAQRNFAFEGQDDWLHAPIVLGDLLLAAGDTAAATKEYQSFLSQWRAAPATVPDIMSARGRLARLRGTSVSAR